MTTYGPVGGYNPDGNTPNPYAQVRFEAIGEAWSMVRAEMGTWVLMMLVYVAITYAVIIPLSLLLNAIGLGGGRSAHITIGMVVGQIISSVVSACLASFFMVGFLQTAIKQLRGAPISIGDLFGGTAFFGKMVGGYLLYQILVVVGLVLLIVPGVLASGGLALTLPLIADGRAGAVESIQLSWKALKSQSFMMFLLLFVAGLLSCLGALACGVGLLVTAPIYYLVLAIVYRDFFGTLNEPVPTIQMPLPPQPFPTNPSNFDV